MNFVAKTLMLLIGLVAMSKDKRRQGPPPPHKTPTVH